MEISKINYLLDNFENIDWTNEALDDFVNNLKNLNLETVDFDSRKKITEFLKKIEVQEYEKNILDSNDQQTRQTEQPENNPVKKINNLLVPILIIVFLVLIGGGIATYTLFSDVDPKIVLNGESKVTLEVNNQYKELNAKVENSKDRKINDKITISGKVDASKLGTYIITYSVTDSSSKKVLKINRTITVVDSTSPKIKLNGADSITIEAGSKYNELGAIVTDNYDKDIQDKLVTSGNVDTTKVGEFTIAYNAIDSSNNKAAEVKRIVKVVDTQKPTLIVNPRTVTINYGDSYDLKSGIKASDNLEGDITSKIVISGTVNSFKLGTYIITYSITDTSGYKTEITRTVNVVFSSQLLEAEMTNLTRQYYNQYIKGKIIGINYHIIDIPQLSSKLNINKLIDPTTGEKCATSSYSKITVVNPSDYNSDITIENHLDCGSYQSPF